MSVRKEASTSFPCDVTRRATSACVAARASIKADHGHRTETPRIQLLHHVQFAQFAGEGFYMTFVGGELCSLRGERLGCRVGACALFVLETNITITLLKCDQGRRKEPVSLTVFSFLLSHFLNPRQQSPTSW
jgi:hypothetical protein